MNDKKITLDEWIEIATDLLTSFSERFSDDGKISLADGFALLLILLKDISKALKENNE